MHKKHHNAMPAKMATKKHSGKKAHAGPTSSRIEKAKNGGFIVNHSQPMGDGPYRDDNQPHLFASAKDMHKHMQETYPEDGGDGGQANVEEPGEQA